MRNTSAGQRGADGDVDEGGDGHGDVDHLVVDAEVHEHFVQVHLLLVFRPQLRRRLDPGDGQHGDVVQLGVVQAIDQVEPSRARGCKAYPQPAGRLAVAGRHEGRRLFVVNQEEPDAVLVAAKALHDPVDAIAGKSEDCVDAPVDEALDEELRGDLLHGANTFLRGTRGEGPETDLLVRSFQEHRRANGRSRSRRRCGRRQRWPSWWAPETSWSGSAPRSSCCFILEMQYIPPLRGLAAETRRQRRAREGGSGHHESSRS